MSDVNVLVSTMNRNNLEFIKQMNIHSQAIIVNQIPNSNLSEDVIIEKNNLKLINTSNKGLSNSRNLLLRYSNSLISIIADDDVVFNNDYKKIVQKAYRDNPEADLIIFQVPRFGDNSELRKKHYSSKKKKINYLRSMKVSAVEITFKTSKIKESNIRFNPYIGAGTEFGMGEENQFLFDCLRAGLKIIYLPIEIGKVDVSESTWFKGYDKEYFVSTGAKFYNMSNKLYPLFILQFAIRKRKLYSDNYSFFQVLNYMNDGVIKYKTLIESSR